jgi:hypothetical protein
MNRWILAIFVAVLLTIGVMICSMGLKVVNTQNQENKAQTETIVNILKEAK